MIVSEIDDGTTFEESMKSLKKRLVSENVERNEKKIAIALHDFSGERKSQISFKKEDLFLVEPSSRKWLYAEKGGDSGWVPKNFIFIFDRVLSEKQAVKDYHSEENNSLSFSKGDLIQIYKENLGWGAGKAGDKIGYFPLKYVAA